MKQFVENMKTNIAEEEKDTRKFVSPRSYQGARQGHSKIRGEWGKGKILNRGCCEN